MSTTNRPTDDLAQVRAGDHVCLHYVCHATLSGVVKDSAKGLVLDIPGDNFVVRRPDGTRADGVEAVRITPRRTGA